MIYAGIDVAKDKLDCCILGSDGEKMLSIFTIPNNRSGFNEFFEKLFSVSKDVSEIKVGLEATGHYSRNLLGSLIEKSLTIYVINSLHTNLYRKGLSLRKTKTATHRSVILLISVLTGEKNKEYNRYIITLEFAFI